MSEALKQIILKKMEIKHKLEQVRKMSEFTGQEFPELVNQLLEDLTSS
ncbi:MAG TPA: hypothetical protein PKE30_04280 [Niabella sp.]|nr:hypothetical protein [Niabella sp.]